MFRKLFVFLLVTSYLINIIQAKEVVCTEYDLKRELKEDLADNGKLDCLRESYDSNGNRVYSDADWDSDCSFESTMPGEHWKVRLQNIYGLPIGLVDVEGNPVSDDFEDQADMCEIIRALIANSK